MYSEKTFEGKEKKKTSLRNLKRIFLVGADTSRLVHVSSTSSVAVVTRAPREEPRTIPPGDANLNLSRSRERRAPRANP